jgi:hypothetical protein
MMVPYIAEAVFPDIAHNQGWLIFSDSAERNTAISQNANNIMDVAASFLAGEHRLYRLKSDGQIEQYINAIVIDIFNPGVQIKQFLQG